MDEERATGLCLYCLSDISRRSLTGALQTLQVLSGSKSIANLLTVFYPRCDDNALLNREAAKENYVHTFEV